MRFLTIFVLCLGLLTGTAMANEMVAANQNNEEVQVRSMDDPANPYVNQYTDLDRWMYEHYDASISWSNYNISMVTAQYPTVALMVEVTAEGWPVPEKVHQHREWMRMSTSSPLYSRESAPKGYAFWANGIIDDELFSQYDSGVWTARMEHFPKIPEWLHTLATDEMTENATFLPDGTILVGLQEPIERRVKSGGVMIPKGPMDNPLEGFYVAYYLYDQSGNRIGGDGENFGLWTEDIWNAYADMKEKDDRVTLRANDSFGNTPNMAMIRGYFAIVDYDESNLMAVYDWDGTLLYDADYPNHGLLVPDENGKVTLPARNANYCRTYNTKFLLQAYDIQKSL